MRPSARTLGVSLNRTLGGVPPHPQRERPRTLSVSPPHPERKRDRTLSVSSYACFCRYFAM